MNLPVPPQDIPALINHIHARVQQLTAEKDSLVVQSRDDEDPELELELLGKIRELLAHLDRGVNLLSANNDALARSSQLNFDLVDVELQWVSAAALERARYDVLLRHVIRPRL